MQFILLYYFQFILMAHFISPRTQLQQTSLVPNSEPHIVFNPQLV